MSTYIQYTYYVYVYVFEKAQAKYSPVNAVIALKKNTPK